MAVKISKNDLEWAGEQAQVSREQTQAIWHALDAGDAQRPKFDFVHVIYYFGALVILVAMGVFISITWNALGNLGIFFVALTYIFLFSVVGVYLWAETPYRTPGGLLVTLAVCAVPLAIYSVAKEMRLDFYGNSCRCQEIVGWFRNGWFWMEVGAIVASLVALRFVRFPFVIAPLAFSLWTMSIDTIPSILDERFSGQGRLWVSVWFGLVMLVVAYLIDHRTKEDYSFWGYLFGLLAFCGGLALMGGDGLGENAAAKFLYCLVNLALILLSVFLERRAFTVFGGLGVFGYLADLTYGEFKDSFFFPIGLSLIGLAIIWLGIQYQRCYPRWSLWINEFLPSELKWLRPKGRVNS